MGEENNFEAGYMCVLSEDEKLKIDNTIEIQKREIEELKKLLKCYRSYIEMLEETSRYKRLE